MSEGNESISFNCERQKRGAFALVIVDLHENFLERLSREFSEVLSFIRQF